MSPVKKHRPSERLEPTPTHGPYWPVRFTTQDPIRILLVDDYPLFRKGICTALAKSGDFNVVAQASSAEETLELARTCHPDLVLLNDDMPGAEGVTTATRITSELNDIHIIMLAKAATPQRVQAAFHAGVHGYVLKGLSSSELVFSIRRVTNGDAYVSPSLATEMLFPCLRRPKNDTLQQLTLREAEVLDLLRQGLTNREIGLRLHLAEKTIKHHMSAILQKLQVRSRTEAALLAAQRATEKQYSCD